MTLSFRLVNSVTLLLLLISLYFCKLVCVIDVNRHGDRTPKPFPLYTSRLFYKSSLSSLTINGYRQNQLLGRWFYERYIENQHFLKEKYDKEEILFRSSPISRTIFSGTGFIQGLYPKYIIKPIFNKEKSNFRNDQLPPIFNFKLKSENFMEVPIYIENTLNDNIIHPIKCKLDKGSKSIIKDELFVHKKMFKHPEGKVLKEVIDDIKKNIPYIFQGLSNEHVYNASFLNDLNKFVWTMENKLIKKYIFKPFTRRVLREQTLDRLYSFRHEDSEGEKLVASGLFDSFLKYFENSIKNEKAYKFILFSAHDTTIMQLISNILDRDYLKTLIHKGVNDQEAYDFLCPKFAASLIFELHEEKGNYFVRIIYNGKELTEDLVKKLKFNKELHGYEYSSFKSYLKERIDQRYKTLFCNTDNEIDYTVVGKGEMNKLLSRVKGINQIKPKSSDSKK